MVKEREHKFAMKYKSHEIARLEAGRREDSKKGAYGLADAGYLAFRFNFPYREKDRKSPDSQKTLVQTWLRAYQFIKEMYDLEKIVAAGKSMGGRVASQMVAEGQLHGCNLEKIKS